MATDREISLILKATKLADEYGGIEDMLNMLEEETDPIERKLILQEIQYLINEIEN